MSYLHFAWRCRDEAFCSRDCGDEWLTVFLGYSAITFSSEPLSLTPRPNYLSKDFRPFTFIHSPTLDTRADFDIMNSKTVSAMFPFLIVVVFLIQLVQGRDIGPSDAYDELTESSFPDSEMRFLLGNELVSGDETDDLTPELTSLDDLPSSQRKKRSLSRIYMMNAVLGSQVIWEAVMWAIRSFTKGWTAAPVT